MPRRRTLTTHQDPMSPKEKVFQELLRAAAAQPGVAELMRLYGEREEVLGKANEYLAPRDRAVTFAASDNSAA